MLILIIPILIFIFLIFIFLLIARNYIKNLSNKSEINSNEILPILISSNQNTEQILPNINLHHQYESIDQLLSILSQLILLIFIFLSSLAIYFHPLYSFKLRFEDIIYSHLYGFIVLFFTFYILSFYVLSRLHLIIRYYFNRNNDNHLSNQSSSINSMTKKDYNIPNDELPLSSLDTISQE